MKRNLRVILFASALALAVFFTSCGKADPTTTGGQTAQQETKKADEADEAKDTTKAPSEKETEAATKADEPASPEDNITGPDEFPIVKEKVTLSVFVAPEPWLGEFKDNWVTEQYEKLTNVHIEWQQVGRDDSANRVNLLLASQADLPDIFMTGINREQQVIYGGQGVFLPLNDYIEEYGVRINKMFDYDASIRGQITAPDGNIYGLPEYNECYHCDFAQRMWINETYLDNLGLEKPQTTEEFREVLTAFKEQDANGNGDLTDEIPLAAANGSWCGNIEPFLMNAFVYHQGTGSDRMFFDENHIIHFAPITEEWREGLRYVKSLYDEGLMDPEIFVMDTDQVRQLTESPDGNRIGAVSSGHVGIIADLAIDGAKLDFGPLAPLEGPAGVRNATRFLTSVNMCFFITNACDQPLIAFRWGDGLINDPNEVLGDRSFFSGEEGVDWRRAKEGEKGLDGRQALTVGILPYGEPHNRHWGQPRPQIVTNESRFSSGTELGAWEHEFVLYDARKNYYDQYGPEQDMVIPPLFMSPEAVEEIGELRTVIRSYIDETFSGFVTGDLDIESDWDTVVNTFQDMGVEHFVSLIQENYDRQYGN